MTIRRIFVGKTGEEVAVDFLKKYGYKILERNFRTGLGELDIIARDKNTICFVEVRTRTSSDKGSGLESITRTKQYRLSRLALSYLKSNRLLNRRARFDIVSILLDGRNRKIEFLKNAFELDRRYTY